MTQQELPKAYESRVDALSSSKSSGGSLTLDPSHPTTERKLWRSLEELADDDQFAAALRREFPEYANRLNDEPTRRRFLQLMGASVALAGVGGCVQQPQETIVAYVRAPEQIVPGKPLYYATAMTLDGGSVGLLVESHMGRPIKIEGNPLHPAVPETMPKGVPLALPVLYAMNRDTGKASGIQDGIRFGASDPFSQAVVLSLYDPDRSQTVLRGGQIDTWDMFVTELRRALEPLQPNGGRGLRILTETVVSPTLADQLQQLLTQYPEARWHQYEPINRDNELLGNRMAFGQDVSALLRVGQADVILSLDADFLMEGPNHLHYARGFADRRRANRDTTAGVVSMNRMYVVESTKTLTGAAADHRLPVSPVHVATFARALATGLGFGAASPSDTDVNRIPQAREWLSAVAQDLQAARGRSLVIAGRNQPPAVHALTHWINESLGNVGQTIEYRPSVEARPEPQVESIRALVNSMQNREVQALVILGGNPVYNAPADLSFAEALRQVPFTIHSSLYEDETSQVCSWHVPASHLLESWSDTRALDGTASIVQPLIAPLYVSKTAHEIVAALAGTPEISGYDLLRDFWRRQYGGEQPDERAFEAFWQTALHDGIVAGSQSQALSPSVTGDLAAVVENEFTTAQAAESAIADAQLHICFRPDPSVWDGRFANNGWLQELPRPLTKLTWDNAALVSPQTASDHDLKTGDVVEITSGKRSVAAPVLILPGQPAGTMTLTLGYGRSRAGRVGDSVGANVYPLRTSDAMWSRGATIRKIGDSHAFATTQHHFQMEGRNLVRAGTLEEYQTNPQHPEFMSIEHGAAPELSMYPEFEYNGYKWGMSIDQSACIGCNSCVVACQAENNIPIVGKDQVALSREMHWLRIDHYYDGETANPASYHQPMMCVHCELAPCEPVCPVAATTHSSEGLNEMIYNRCVGTRYCSNNCPYKVRRFNFFDYNAELREDPTQQLRPNPDVTIRSRGVMEKCTYCVQRINAARIQAEKETRTIRDGEMVTACQAACPSAAIVFGDLNDPNSEVVRMKRSALTYSVLGELNTRPRTTHLAVVRNPHPVLASIMNRTDEPAH